MKTVTGCSESFTMESYISWVKLKVCLNPGLDPKKREREREW